MKRLTEWKVIGFPPTINNSHGHAAINGRVQVFPSKELKVFQHDTLRQLEEQGIPDLTEYSDSTLALYCRFFSPRWLTVEGFLRRHMDVSNRYKVLEDVIFRALDIDDSRNILPHPQACLGDREYMIIGVYDLSTEEHQAYFLDGKALPLFPSDIVPEVYTRQIPLMEGV